MLKMRLQRVGRTHEPSFRLVLTDSDNSTKSGRFKEVLGSYDPRKIGEAFKIDRIKHWLSLGAGLTPTVNNLLIRKGIIRGKKIHVSYMAPVPVATPVAEVTPELAPESTQEPAEVTQPAPEAVVEKEGDTMEVVEEAPAIEGEANNS